MSYEKAVEAIANYGQFAAFFRAPRPEVGQINSSFVVRCKLTVTGGEAGLECLRELQNHTEGRGRLWTRTGGDHNSAGWTFERIADIERLAHVLKRDLSKDHPRYKAVQAWCDCVALTPGPLRKEYAQKRKDYQKNPVAMIRWIERTGSAALPSYSNEALIPERKAAIKALEVANKAWPPQKLDIYEQIKLLRP